MAAHGAQMADNTRPLSVTNPLNRCLYETSDIKRDRQKDREVHRQTDTHTHTHTKYELEMPILSTSVSEMFLRCSLKQSL